MEATPLQFTPPSSVIKTKISVPEEVNAGAIPPGQRTVAGQFCVLEPPFFNSKIKPQAFGGGTGFENVQFVVKPVLAMT